MAYGSLSDILDTLCSSVAKLHLAPSRTLSNRWRHERLHMLEKAATAILREPTKIITDTKGHHTLRLEGQFEDCDESEEEAVLLVGQFRRMKISVRNLDKLPRTCRRATLRRVRQALIPYQSKPVVFKPNVGRARCGALFNLRNVVEQRVKLHYMQQPQGRVPPKFGIVICVDATPFWKANATRGDVYIDLADSTRSAGRPSLWSTWFTFDGSDDADPLRLADKLGQLDAQVGELQRDGIATPTVTVEVECFLTGDGKGMCAGHTKLKCRCWHCDLAFEDFGGDNLRPSDFIISIQWGVFLRSIPPTRRVGDMVHCRCKIVNAIFKRLFSDGQISQGRALGPLLRSVVQSVMQAATHIPSEIRDAPRPTKDGNFDLAGGRWFARDQANHAKVVQLIQQHVGPQERVVVGGTRIPLHAVIQRMLLSLWYMEKCWSNKIGLTNKEVESYRWAVGQFANDWRALQWQPTVWVHWTCVHSGWFAAKYRNFYIFLASPPKGGTWSSRWTSAIHF